MEQRGIFTKGGDRGGTDRSPRAAATVILVRDRADALYEVLLMRRGRNQAFMGGAFVFPGGSLDESDLNPELAACVAGFSATDAKRLLQENDLPEAVAFGLFMAAIRETFEVACVLLARGERGGRFNPAASETASRLDACRRELHERRLTLAELAVVKSSSRPRSADSLRPLITPEIEGRFDARFVLALLPAGQLPVHDRMELMESRWLDSATALAEHAAGRIVLMPPTLKTVEELLGFSDTESLFSAARARQIRSIFPNFFQAKDGFGIRFPPIPNTHRRPFVSRPAPVRAPESCSKAGSGKAIPSEATHHRVVEALIAAWAAASRAIGTRNGEQLT